MARHPKVVVEISPPVESSTFADWAGKARERAKTVPAGRWVVALKGVEERMAGSSWDDARPLDFVAAYAVQHLKVYGVDASELVARERHTAMLAAGRMLKEVFDGDAAAMADFIRWTWRREHEREVWRRQNNRSGGRLGWRLQFGGALIADYQLDKARRAARPAAR